MRKEIETNFPSAYRAMFICSRWLPMKGCGASVFLRPAIEYHLVHLMRNGHPRNGYSERRMLMAALLRMGLGREARRIANQSYST